MMRVSFGCVLVVSLALLTAGLVPVTAQAQEDLTALVNVGFETGWTDPDPIPGWEAVELIGDTIYSQYLGGECTCLGPDPNHRLKFEIGGGDEREALIVKQVNWGSATSITEVRIDAGSHSWGGQGQAGLGIDLDGGTPGPTSWTDCGANITEYTGPVSADACQTLSLSGLTKPGGATTFNIVVRAYRPTGNWNAHFDNLFVSATDPNPPPQPDTTSPTHNEGVWNANDEIIVNFQTFNADDYSYVFDHSAATDPGMTANTTIGQATLSGADNSDIGGDWWFHVRAHNSFGWSPVDHFGPLPIDDAVPVVSNVVQSASGCVITADVSDTGGSPFGVSNIELLGNTNLLSNGGFETGDLTGWTVEGTNPQVGETESIFVPPAGEPYEGTYMVHLGTCCDINYTFTLYQEVPTVVGRFYRSDLRACVATTPGGTMTAQLQYVDGVWGGPAYTIDSVSSAGDQIDWALLQGEFLALNDTATVAITVTVTGASPSGLYAAIRLDDVSMTAFMGNPDTYAGGVATWDGVLTVDGDVLSAVATDEAGNSASADSGILSACDPGIRTEVDRPLWHELR